MSRMEALNSSVLPPYVSGLAHAENTPMEALAQLQQTDPNTIVTNRDLTAALGGMVGALNAFITEHGQIDSYMLDVTGIEAVCPDGATMTARSYVKDGSIPPVLELLVPIEGYTHELKAHRAVALPPEEHLNLLSLADAVATPGLKRSRQTVYALDAGGYVHPYTPEAQYDAPERYFRVLQELVARIVEVA